MKIKPWPKIYTITVLTDNFSTYSTKLITVKLAGVRPHH